MPPDTSNTEELLLSTSPEHARISAKTLARAVVLVGLAALVALGWRELWFLTDDSFITFRYIDHFRRGWGYTWNPPPFQPVEGYSNFLWMVILHGVWVLTGVEPPRSANVVALAFAYGSLGLAFAATYRVAWPERLHPYRFWLAAAVVLFAATHRTFLTWTSSGLETSLFAFCTMLWVFGTLEAGRTRSLGGMLAMCAGAALGALTRPDGMLFVMASGAFMTYRALAERAPRDLRAAVPLLLVPAHVLWRYSYYGAWVPNTYYAKQVSIWPEAGLRYAGSFVLEHAVWAWAIVALLLLVRSLRTLERDGLPAGSVAPRLGAALVVLTLAAHAIYFVLLVGGDHFEYRVFAHAVLPLGIALLVMLGRLGLGAPQALSLFVLIAALGEVLPWVHYARTRNLEGRPETFKLFAPVADAFPEGPLRRYAAAFDSLQKWMMPRHVGTRHQEHKVFLHNDALPFYPERRWGETIHWDQRAVLEINTVGVVGWVLPEVAILDRHGLNDWVVSHTPATNWAGERLMAHERTPPPGYVACFLPNIALSPRKATVLPRETPLTDERIRECEARFRAGLR